MKHLYLFILFSFISGYIYCQKITVGYSTDWLFNDTKIEYDGKLENRSNKNSAIYSHSIFGDFKIFKNFYLTSQLGQKTESLNVNISFWTDDNPNTASIIQDEFERKSLYLLLMPKLQLDFGKNSFINLQMGMAFNKVVYENYPCCIYNQWKKGEIDYFNEFVFGGGINKIFKEKFLLGIQFNKYKSNKLIDTDFRPAVNTPRAYMLSLRMGVVLTD